MPRQAAPSCLFCQLVRVCRRGSNNHRIYTNVSTMAPWLPHVLWRICFRPTHYSMKLPLHCQWHCSRTNKTIVLHLSSLDQSILVCFVGLCSHIHDVSGLKLKDCIYVRNSLFIVDLHLARIRMALSVFVNFWAQDASIMKISVAIIKRRS